MESNEGKVVPGDLRDAGTTAREATELARQQGVDFAKMVEGMSLEDINKELERKDLTPEAETLLRSAQLAKQQ